MKINGGNILHIASSSAKTFPKNKGPYGIAKAALVKLIQYFAVEFAEYNIFINGITPTYVITPRHKSDIRIKAKKENVSEQTIEQRIINSQLIKKPLYSEDLIPLMNLLISTKVITGQIYNCTLGEVISY